MTFRSLILNEPRQQTRADYRCLSTDEILKRIAAANDEQEHALGDDEAWNDATFALQELRAVLQERG